MANSRYNHQYGRVRDSSRTPFDRRNVLNTESHRRYDDYVTNPADDYHSGYPSDFAHNHSSYLSKYRRPSLSTSTYPNSGRRDINSHMRDVGTRHTEEDDLDFIVNNRNQYDDYDYL